MSTSASNEQASVAIGDYRNEADDDLDAKETEEAKRLLYVALTRARDRLYLGATVNQDGRFRPPKGSIGRVMPAPICDLLSQAGAADAPDTVEWTGESARHRLRVVRASGSVEELAPDREQSAPRADAFEPLSAADAPVRRAVTASVAVDAHGTPLEPERHAASRAAALEIGVLVHRGLQAGLAGDADGDLDRQGLVSLVRPDERALIGDLEAVVDAAAAILIELRGRQLPAERVHEVPFSFRRDDGVIVRGAIDALVEHPDGRVEVLEFKTGRALPEHQEQLAIYVAAARALYPRAQVHGRIIYAHGQLSRSRGV